MSQVMTATLLSVIFPGLGQLYNRHKVRGILFMFHEFTLLFMWIHTLGIIGRYPFYFWIATVLEAAVSGAFVHVRRKKQNKPPEYKKAWIRVGYGFLGAILSVGILWYSFNATYDRPAREKAAVKQEVLTYLESKYHEEFVIMEIRYIWAIDDFELKVHPKQTPEIMFHVTESVNKDRKYHDDYKFYKNQEEGK